MQGFSWEVLDEKELANLIARVALGQARHVQKILASAAVALPPPAAEAWDAAIKTLTVAPGSDPWHRDGWMFQVMSWLSASKAAPSSLMNPPHLIHAQKGFDGIQLEFDGAGAISAVVIFEDKATDNPRETIRTDVWPEFARFESGEYGNVLVAEVTGLLEKRAGVDVDEVIQKVIWKDARHYRVSITVGDAHSSPEGFVRLFKDYDVKVLGDVKRRRGETFYVNDLRPWMDKVAAEAVAHILILKAAHV